MSSNEWIPIGTKVLLYRPLGKQSVTVGTVVMSDSNPLHASYGMYGISDGLDTEKTSEMMRPGLDFVVPERGVRVIDNTKRIGNATVDVVQSIDGELCLNVTYDAVANWAIYEWGNGLSDFLIGNFRYEGLPLMNVGTKIKSL